MTISSTPPTPATSTPVLLPSQSGSRVPQPGATETNVSVLESRSNKKKDQPRIYRDGKRPQHLALRNLRDFGLKNGNEKLVKKLVDIRAEIEKTDPKINHRTDENRLWIAETLYSLKDDLNVEEAQDILKALRKHVRMHKPTEEEILNPHLLKKNIYKLLSGTKYVINGLMSEVNLHGCSHYFAPMLVRVVLEKAIKDGRQTVSVIHGIGLHGKQNIGKMRAIAVRVVSAPEYKRYVREVKTDLNKAENSNGTKHEGVGGSLYATLCRPPIVLRKKGQAAGAAPTLSMEEFLSRIRELPEEDDDARENAIVDLADAIADLDPGQWKEGFATVDAHTYACLNVRVAGQLAAKMKRLGTFENKDREHREQFRQRFQPILFTQYRDNLSEYLRDYLEGEIDDKDIFAQTRGCPRFCVIGKFFNAVAYAHRT